MLSADVKSLVLAAGAVAAGVAEAGPVDDMAAETYARWIARGCHGEMGYLDRYHEVRNDPRLLLDGAVSIVAAAFSYNTVMPEGPLRWARYAVGTDYHDEVRRRLTEVAAEITAQTGAQCRVCVDTAPLRERYWASRAGIGFIGLNNLLIVPGAGSWCVLGFILTTLPLAPDSPCTQGCGECRRCVTACPGHALDGCGGMDARRCRSYLTIEYRGDDIPGLGERVYGCDICQEVCPHNRGAAQTRIEGFAPRPEIVTLGREDILSMRQEDFSRIFKGSPIKRAKLAGLVRNALRTGRDPGERGNLGDGQG